MKFSRNFDDTVLPKIILLTKCENCQALVPILVPRGPIPFPKQKTNKNKGPIGTGADNKDNF